MSIWHRDHRKRTAATAYGVVVTEPNAEPDKINVHARRCGSGPADRTRRHATDAAISVAASVRACLAEVFVKHENHTPIGA